MWDHMMIMINTIFQGLKIGILWKVCSPLMVEDLDTGQLSLIIDILEISPSSRSNEIYKLEPNFQVCRDLLDIIQAQTTELGEGWDRLLHQVSGEVFIWIVWKLKNQSVHGEDSEKQRQTFLEKMLPACTALYHG